jgi:hypothetical protein
MSANGFKSVGWAAGVGAAALCCYMLSLNVAAERAELLKIESQIVAAKQDIRGLQTELGTRGRLTQLEHWNAEVLALSAPESQQFLPNAFRLASLTEPAPPVGEVVSNVRLASADAAGADAKVRTAVATGFTPAETKPIQPLLRQASIVTPPSSPLAEKKPMLVKAAALKVEPAPAEPRKKPAAKPDKSRLIDADLVAAISDAAKAEKKKSGGSGGQ